VHVAVLLPVLGPRHQLEHHPPRLHPGELHAEEREELLPGEAVADALLEVGIRRAGRGHGLRRSEIGGWESGEIIKSDISAREGPALQFGLASPNDE
jgi:hypothetical protein